MPVTVVAVAVFVTVVVVVVVVALVVAAVAAVVVTVEQANAAGRLKLCNAKVFQSQATAAPPGEQIL